VYSSEYYKSLFGPPDKNFFTMIESETSDIPQLSEEEYSILIADFTHKEVFDAIMQMVGCVHRCYAEAGCKLNNY
jgi:hypothetical protein